MSAAACGDGREATLEKAPASIEVRVAKAAVQPLVQTFDAGGIVKARTTAQISSRIVAELQEMRVQPGDRVRQGQIVAVLDDRDLRRPAFGGASLARRRGKRHRVGRGRARIGRCAAGAGSRALIDVSSSCANRTPRRPRSRIARPPNCGWRRQPCARPTPGHPEASASVTAAAVCDPSGRSGRLVFDHRCAI